MIRWTDSPLTQSQAHIVATHWDDIVQHLAPPTVAWEWSESDLAPRTKHRLKQENLVEQAAGGRWRTTEKLWLDVIDRAEADEDLGHKASGQELLGAPVEEERDSWLLTHQSPSFGKFVQQTLTGDAVEIMSDDGYSCELNREKAKREADDDSVAASGQLSLEGFGVGQTKIGTWLDVLGVGTDLVGMDAQDRELVTDGGKIEVVTDGGKIGVSDVTVTTHTQFAQRRNVQGRYATYINQNAQVRLDGETLVIDLQVGGQNAVNWTSIEVRTNEMLPTTLTQDTDDIRGIIDDVDISNDVKQTARRILTVHEFFEDDDRECSQERLG